MTNPRVEISVTDVLGSSTLSKSQGLAQGWAYLFRSSILVDGLSGNARKLKKPLVAEPTS